MKIKFDNGLTGEEFRMYQLTTDARQYFLCQLKEAYTVTEVDGVEIKVEKVVDGEKQYSEVNKRNYPKLEMALSGYLTREQYDCNAKTFEELGSVIRAAHGTIIALSASLMDLKL